MTGSGTIFRIAIFGRDHEIWPIAALLAKELPENYQLTVVESPVAAQPAALTLPMHSRYLDRLGLKAENLIKQCNGILGLGTELIGWHGEGSSFFTAPSGKLPHIDGMDLHQVMLRAAYMTGEQDRFAYLFQPFRFAARAAEAGKCALPSAMTNSPTAVLGPTVQMDREKYVELLKKQSIDQTTQLVGMPTNALVNEETGAISSVLIDDGQSVEADLYIDTSSHLSQLLPDHFDAGMISLAEQIPFDRMAGCIDDMPVPADHVQSRIRALPNGILIETPLAEGGISRLLFASDEMDEEHIRPLIGENSAIETFSPGYCATPWTGNLLRMGSAAGRLGPMQSADMLALQEQALLLVGHLPISGCTKVEAEAYNQLQKAWIDEIRDFSLLTLKLNHRSEAVWRTTQDAAPPESLERRIGQFENRARFVPYENELFDEQTWIELLIGFTSTPRRYDPVAEKLDMALVQKTLKNLVGDFTQAISSMPDQAVFMQDYRN